MPDAAVGAGGRRRPTRSARSVEYARMLFERMHGEQRWENQPAVGWSVEDLDVAEVRRTVAEAVRRGRLEEPPSREPSDLLRGLGLLRGGVLLLSNAERFLRDTLPIAGRFERDRFERIDEPLYPPLATREALANALCHRDYSVVVGSVGVAVYDDRLEVNSSGPLPFGLTPEHLFRPARVAAVEPVDRPHLLPPRRHRGVGGGDAEDGGPDEQRGSAATGDRG